MVIIMVCIILQDGPAKSVVPLAMPPKVLYHINLPGKSGHLDNLDNYEWFQYPYKAIALVKSY